MSDTGEKIDVLSQVLGAIQADIKHLLGTTTSINDKVEKLQEQAVEQRLISDAAHKRIDKIGPKVEEHERLKNKGIGVLAAVGTTFGVVGAFISKLLQGFLS